MQMRVWFLVSTYYVLVVVLGHVSICIWLPAQSEISRGIIIYHSMKRYRYMYHEPFPEFLAQTVST